MENFSYLKSPALKSDRASPLCLSLTTPLPPSLSFLFSKFLARQMRGRGSQHPYIGVGGRPPPSRAAWEAGRPAAGRPVPRDLSAIFFPLFFADKPLPPGSRAARSRPPGSGAGGVYFCKFPYQKYIFVKNGNKKYKNIKTACRRLGYQ